MDLSAGWPRQDQLNSIWSCQQSSEDIQEEEAAGEKCREMWVEPSSHCNPARWGLMLVLLPGSREAPPLAPNQDIPVSEESPPLPSSSSYRSAKSQFTPGQPGHKVILGSTPKRTSPNLLRVREALYIPLCSLVRYHPGVTAAKPFCLHPPWSLPTISDMHNKSTHLVQVAGQGWQEPQAHKSISLGFPSVPGLHRSDGRLIPPRATVSGWRGLPLQQPACFSHIWSASDWRMGRISGGSGFLDEA